MESTVSVASIVLASIGVLATGVGYVLRQYNEDRRIARNVLFNLLGIWEVCIVLSEPPDQLADHAIDDYKSAVIELFGIHAAEQINPRDPQFQALFKPLLIQLILSNRPTLDDELRDRYLLSLTKLSERHPILAYKLTGREKTQELFRAVEAYEAHVVQALELALEKEEISEVLGSAQRLTRKSIINQLIDEVEKDIRRIAWAAGISNWLRCIFICRKSKRRDKFYNQARSETKDQFISILRQLTIEQSKQKSNSATTAFPFTEQNKNKT